MTTNLAAAVATTRTAHPCETTARGPRTRPTGTLSARATRNALTLHLPADPAAVGPVRRATAGALREWGVADGDVDDIVLMVDELVTNAIEHGHGPVSLRVRRRRDWVICKIGDGSHEAPRPRDSDPDAESGRGLLLVDALADTFGTRITATGKVIWFRHHIRSAPIPDPRPPPPSN